MSKYFLIPLIFMLASCDTAYKNFSECAVKEEQKGASRDTAADYCASKVRSGEFDCDGNSNCEIYMQLDSLK